MNTDRPCGCKSFRSCFICEKEFGIPSSEEGAQVVEEYDQTFVFCPDKELLFPVSSDSPSDLKSFLLPAKERQESPDSTAGITFPGVKLIRDFITEEEETKLIADLDNLPWDSSQSGRRKQNFGPRANFKKRKTKAGPFAGFPACTKFVQDRFASQGALRDYHTVEQCSIEYQPETGSCIEPHIDDCWIWGERIVQLNLLADSFLTCVPYKGSKSKYNLNDVAGYPKVLDSQGKVKFNAFDPENRSQTDPYNVKEPDSLTVEGVVKIPLPRRSLLIFYDEPRYDWLHCILREDVPHRRVVIAYREFTPPYLPGGSDEEVGKDILEKAAQFWT